MEDPPELIQPCLLCVDEPQPHCLFCLGWPPLQDHDWQQTQPSYHNDPFSHGGLQSADLSITDAESAFNFSAASDLSYPASSHLTHIWHGANLELQFPDTLVSQPVATPPLTRRRNWTVKENCDFEEWITINPNPTKQQKQDFADGHYLLTAAQVQSKINNWRNGRNSRRKQSTDRNERCAEVSGNHVRDIDQSMDGDTAERNASALNFANGNEIHSRTDYSPVPQSPRLDITSREGNSRSMSNTPLTRIKIDELLLELSNQKGILDSIDDTLENREEAVEEVRAWIRNLEARILELRKGTATAASNPQLIGSAVKRSSYRALSLISSPELEVDIDHINLALHNASMECLGARSAAEDVEDESWSMDYHSENTPPPERSNACDWCIARDIFCDGELPCSPCDKDGAPCSNCMTEWHPEPLESDTQNHFPYSKFDEGNLAALRLTLLGGFNLDNPAKERSPSRSPSLRHAFSQSRAHSVASAATSRSVASMHSARYSVKLNRRRSANSRRNSSESRAGIAPRSESGPAIRHPKTISRPPSRVSEQTKKSMKDDKGAEYFRCPIIGCLEVFSSRLVLDTHEKLAHSQSYCTFCDRSFKDKAIWQSHEEAHIIYEIESYFHFNHILWKCGICGTFGLSVSRRHLHIINHWQEGYTKEDWTGTPMIMLLDSTQASHLLGQSQNVFQLNAEDMLRRHPETVLCFSTTSKKDFLIVQHLPREREPPLNTTAKEHKNSSSGRPQAIPKPARSVVHGLFASIRNKLFRSKKEAHKPPEMQVHSFGPEEARSQYHLHKSWNPP